MTNTELLQAVRSYKEWKQIAEEAEAMIEQLKATSPQKWTRTAWTK